MPYKKIEFWKRAALRIGKIIENATARHPQLVPLHTSWLNFARKHQVHQPNDSNTLTTLLKAHGLQIILTANIVELVSTVHRQTEEIKALEYRITTLLRR